MGNDEQTPPVERRFSEEATVLANLASAIESIAVQCAQAAINIDRLKQSERRGFLDRLANGLGHLGDTAHEARQAIQMMGEDKEHE